MITSAQLRAARAMTGLTIGELSAAAGLPPSLIFDLEADIHSGDETVLRALQQALEDNGIVFIGNGEQERGGPGIRLRADPHVEDDGIRPENLNAANDD